MMVMFNMVVTLKYCRYEVVEWVVVMLRRRL